MKLLTTYTLLFLVSTLLLADTDPFSEGDDGQQSKPFHVRVRLKMIEIPQTELTQLTRNPQPLEKNLYTSIRRLMKSGKAKLVHESVAMCRSGEKSTTESICEMIYPTEYEPPGYSPPPKLPSTAPHVRPPGSTSTAFETRNVGVTLDVEALVNADRKTIDLSIAPEHVMFNRNITYLTHKDQWGKADIFFPEFHTERSNTSITLLNKETRFISSHTPLGNDGKHDPSRKILMFVQASVITP